MMPTTVFTILPKKKEKLKYNNIPLKCLNNSIKILDNTYIA